MIIKFLKKYKIFLSLLIILSLGFYLRFYNLGRNPAGFFCDEASVGYNAYSLLTSGKDEWGKSWPLFFKAFGEYKGPVMIYSSIPFVYVFGLSEFSIRLTSVFFGILTVLALYFLVKEVFNFKIALLSSLLLAVSPWHVHFSRVSLEGLTAFVFFTVLGTYFWVKFLKTSINYAYLSIFTFALALYSYFPARIFIPLYCFILVIISWAKIKKNLHSSLNFLVWALILSIPLILHLITGDGLSRWNQVKGNFGPIFLIKKYLEYFSVNYLFFDGDISFPGQFISRHSLKGMGELYLLQLPLILLGLFYYLKNIKQKPQLFLLPWLLFFPLCDLFTNSTSPQATRTIIGVIPWQILTALGIYYLFIRLHQNLFRIIYILSIFLLLTVSVFNFKQSLNDYPSYSSDYWGWQYGPREIINYFQSNQGEYDQLCMEGQFNSPEIFIKFYDPTNICQGKCQICDTTAFNPMTNQLFALSKESYDKLKSSNKNILIKDTIYYPNKDIAFILLELKQPNEY